MSHLFFITLCSNRSPQASNYRYKLYKSNHDSIFRTTPKSDSGISLDLNHNMIIKFDSVIIFLCVCNRRSWPKVKNFLLVGPLVVFWFIILLYYGDDVSLSYEFMLYTWSFLKYKELEKFIEFWKCILIILIIISNTSKRFDKEHTLQLSLIFLILF